MNFDDYLRSQQVHKAPFVDIVSEELRIIITATYSGAVQWVNENQDVVDNGLVQFFEFDGTSDGGEGDRLVPVYGVDGQSHDCSGFTKLIIH